MKNSIQITMAASKLQLLAKKLIKPSSPMPHLNYKLSLIDQLYPFKYMPVALFYPGYRFKNDSTAAVLESSLSTLLNAYYPFAGRIENNLSVNCNNMGAAFLESRVNSTMSKILKGPHQTLQDTVFPRGLPWLDVLENEGIPLAVQLNHFDCGGKAIGVCMSHKLADGSAMVNFLRDWAGVAYASQLLQEHKLTPQLTGASICPPIEDPQTPIVYDFENKQSIATRRLFFSSSKINQLKARVTSESGLQNPSRFEALSAFIMNQVATISSMHPHLSKPYLIYFTANLHHLVTPQIPQTVVGNFFVPLQFLIANVQDMTLSTLVTEIRRKKLELHDKYKGMKLDEALSRILEENQKLQLPKEFEYSFVTSQLKFPFHNVDFGWGKPTKVTAAAPPWKSGFLLINDPNGDGVEAIVPMDKQIASSFETDHEILEFASLDPTY